jgi:hypothetical protein
MKLHEHQFSESGLQFSCSDSGHWELGRLVLGALLRVAASLLIAILFLVLVLVFALAGRRRASPPQATGERSLSLLAPPSAARPIDSRASR